MLEASHRRRVVQVHRALANARRAFCAYWRGILASGSLFSFRCAPSRSAPLVNSPQHLPCGHQLLNGGNRLVNPCLPNSGLVGLREEGMASQRPDVPPTGREFVVLVPGTSGARTHHPLACRRTDGFWPPHRFVPPARGSVRLGRGGSSQGLRFACSA
jgi:hypothetical protein